MKTIIRTAAATALLVFGINVSYAEVKIGIAAEPYPPFMEQASDGTWKGWEIEIVDALCAAMEEECELVPVAWDGIIPALLAKKFDAIMASMSITEERMQTIDFSEKYYSTPATIVGAKDLSITGDPASLKGMRVGVQVSTTHANYVEAHFAEVAEVKTYAGFDEHNQDLFAGRIDAVVGDSLAMQPFLTSDEGKGFEVKAELHDETIFGPGVGAGIRKGETELAEKFNAAIAKIREDGTYEEISSQYFNFDIYGGK